MEDAVNDKLVRSASELNAVDSFSDSKRLKKAHGLSMAQDSFLMDHVINSGAQQLLYDQAEVSLTLAKHLMLNYGKDSNLVFSPISIQVSLALIAAGSSAQTLEQLLSFLKAETIDDLTNLYSYLVATVFSNGEEKSKYSSSGICFSFANGVWLDKSVSFKPPFKEVVETLYKAASHQVDFQNKAGNAINFVNSWVTDKTGGLIKEILSPGSVDNLTRIVFANALYFKGEWATVFNASRTKRYEFHLLNGESVKVPFMTSDKERHVRAFDGFKVLKLPYKQSWDDERSFSMYIFLPDARDGLPALVEKAGSESEFFNRHIPINRVRVGKFRIPKFKFEYEIELSEELKKLGLVLPFDPNAGLSEIVDGPIPYIVSNIFHTSFIEVNEEGTEAAASTRRGALGGSCMSRKIEKIDFVADHPFLFVIREDTSRIVHFMGHVLNPSRT